MGVSGLLGVLPVYVQACHRTYRLRSLSRSVEVKEGLAHTQHSSRKRHRDEGSFFFRKVLGHEAQEMLLSSFDRAIHTYL